MPLDAFVEHVIKKADGAEKAKTERAVDRAKRLLPIVRKTFRRLQVACVAIYGAKSEQRDFKQLEKQAIDLLNAIEDHAGEREGSDGPQEMLARDAVMTPFLNDAKNLCKAFDFILSPGYRPTGDAGRLLREIGAAYVFLCIAATLPGPGKVKVPWGLFLLKEIDQPPTGWEKLLYTLEPALLQMVYDAGLAVDHFKKYGTRELSRTNKSSKTKKAKAIGPQEQALQIYWKKVSENRRWAKHSDSQKASDIFNQLEKDRGAGTVNEKPKTRGLSLGNIRTKILPDLRRKGKV